MPRTVLLVSYYYPPLGGIGSQRVLSWARHLPEHGWRAVVVAPEEGAFGLDRCLDPTAGGGAVVVRTGTREPAVLLRKLRRRKDAAPASAAGDMVDGLRGGAASRLARKLLHWAAYYPDHARGWIGPATRAAVAAAREHRAVAIVSSSPPVSAHVVALSVGKRLGLPVVLDFRDLWTAHREGEGSGPRFLAERRLERRLLERAAAVTTVSEACRAWLLSRYATGSAKPFHVLRNGFEEADFAGPAPAREPGVFRIVHTGTVYGDRQDLTSFFFALEALREAGSFGLLRPEVVLAGKVDPQAVEAAAQAGCDDLLRLPGFVTHEEAVRLQRTATVNLLLTWSVPGVVAAGVCPGKMYEQMAADRPVLALALPECEAVGLLRAAGGALIADPRDESAIAGHLGALAAAERAGDAASAAPARSPDLARHSRRAVAAQLASLLDTL